MPSNFDFLCPKWADLHHDGLLVPCQAPLRTLVYSWQFRGKKIMQAITGIVKDGQIIANEPAEWPNGTRVRIERMPTPEKPFLRARMARPKTPKA
jgi:hypothetical protein